MPSGAQPLESAKGLTPSIRMPFNARTPAVKLYAFDQIDSSLKLIPLAARRALDALGAKLSLQGFHSLTLEDRKKLVEAGSGDSVNTDAARDAIRAAVPAPAPVEISAEPHAESTPEELVTALRPFGPLSDEVWRGLSPLDRYVLVKVTQKNKRNRIEGAYREIVGPTLVSTHVRPQGGVHMVSIADKPVTLRKARAECFVSMTREAYDRLVSQTAPKGDVLSTARLAGIMATKKTSDLIPLCHPLALHHVDLSFEELSHEAKIRVTCAVAVEARTGVEMEAMVGANIAALTIYDMLKSVDRQMVVGPARLLEKSGGRSGTFTHSGDA
jgi:cyclic pyranopterin monophosphate synthase